MTTYQCDKPNDMYHIMSHTLSSAAVKNVCHARAAGTSALANLLVKFKYDKENIRETKAG